MSIKTSNSQEQIEKMEFWKFRNLLKSLNKYLDAENNNNNGAKDENSTEDFKKNLSSQSGKMMSDSKNMLKGNKPKLK